MSLQPFNRSASLIALCTILIVIVVTFGVRASYDSALYFAIAVTQCLILCLAAWKVGASAIRADALESRQLAIGGGLLLLPWAVFSFLAGFGAPQVATPAENQLRYLLLLCNTVAVTGGLVVLRSALSGAGERFFSTLGFAAVMCASPLYAVFTAISLAEYRALDRGTAPPVSELNLVDELSLTLLFVGVVLTYLATAAFAAALRKCQWIGMTGCRVLVGISIGAAACVGIKIAVVFSSAHEPIWNFAPWYALPGQVLSIPAVPWMMLCAIGIIVLRRAGNSHDSTLLNRE